MATDSQGSAAIDNGSLDCLEDRELALRTAIHDLSGPVITAKGYVEELRLVREDLMVLTEHVDVPDQSLDAIRENIDTELGICLSSIEKALKKLDDVLEHLRHQRSS